MTFGAQSASANGWTVSVRPYSGGDAGIRQSLQEVTRLMRLAKDDPRIKRWAVETLSARGIDGRNRPSIRQQAQALLDAFRAQTIYVPDSAGAEHVQAAQITLCLGDQCIPGEDCESLCLALGGAMLSIGLPAYAVKVDYGSGHQQHLVLGLIDDAGDRFYVDPSTNKPILDSMTGAVDLEWVDPLDQAGTLGTVGAEIVTLGAVAQMLDRRREKRALFQVNGTWHEHRYGRWWTHSQGRWSARSTGVGAPFSRNGKWWIAADGSEVELNDAQAQAFGLGAPTTVVTSQTQFQTVTDNSVHTGLRYRILLQVLFSQDPSTVDQITLTSQFSSNWFIESFEPVGSAQSAGSNFGQTSQTDQWTQEFVLQGIALSDQTLANTATVTYESVSVQSSSASPVTNAVVPSITPTPSNNLSLIGVAAVAAVVGGVGYSVWRRRKR
jgi:hypothetical protein